MTTSNSNYLNLLSGESWDDSTVTYSFMTQIPSYMNPDDDGNFEITINGESTTVSNFQPFNNQQEGGAENALQLIEDIANISFQEVSDANDGGQIRFGTGNPSTNFSGWAYYPGDNAGGDIWLANDQTSNLTQTPGSFGFLTMIHEIGHALGLKHSFESPALPAAEDNYQYTVMSYTSHPGSGVEPSTPMLYDIAAIQHLYGANNTTDTGNNTYSWNPNTAFVKTIWDAGGIDTIDAGNQTLDATINLTAGTFSSIGPYSNGSNTSASNNLAIAYDVTIENAIGGSGNDAIFGNDADNNLDGENGNDTIEAFGGDDRVRGDDGDDLIYAGSGDDRVRGDDGNDLIDAGSGDDRVRGDDGDDLIYAGSGDDRARGRDGHDTIDGESGNDRVRGDDGDDELIGGTENDVLNGGSGDDILTGSNPSQLNSGAGELDTLTGGAGRDIFVLGDVVEAYYNGDGVNGFVTITDFDLTEGDKFRVYNSGNIGDYTVNAAGTEIFFQGDLIAVVEGTTPVIPLIDPVGDFIFA